MQQWQAKWITDPEFASCQPLAVFHKEYEAWEEAHHPAHLRNRHMLVRKAFVLEQQPLQANLRITGDDYYKLYINGQFVGQGPAQGYPFHYNYNEWEVASYLQAGNNVIAVHVYYQGHINRSYNSGDLRQGMIAELYVNQRLHLISDSSWKYRVAKHYGDGETVGYETQYLEHIDQRLAEPQWKALDYADGHWAFVAEKQAADYKLAAQQTPPVSVYELAPKQVVELDKGHYLIDFGMELTGQFTLKACGLEGQELEIRYGEELQEDQQAVRYDMRCNCLYKEIWILSGKEDWFEPFEYKAFRYVEVIGPPEVLLPASFKAIVRHYPLDPQACSFQSSDAMLNQIWDICKRGVQLCAQESYVDCPSREKGQYLGDNTIMGHTHMYISGDLRLFKKAIYDFALSSAICPGLMAVAPGNFMQEIADFSLQWPQQVLLYYEHSGDQQFLREMYPYAENVLAYFQKYRRSDGLLESVQEKWNLVDWPENLRDGYDFPLTRPVSDGCHNVVNAFYYGCVAAVQKMKDILGISYSDELPALRKAFIDVFYRQETGLFVDAVDSAHHSLHANILPHYVGIAPDEAKQAFVAMVRSKRMSCGVYMSYFLLKALAACGESDLLYELITCRDERSWVNMINEGATACFEAWGKEQKWNTSLCHGWASSPIPLLIEEIIGIKPAAPGWSEVAFNPCIPEAMPDFELEFRTVREVICVEYKQGELSLVQKQI
ncbi:hypothetical protein J40TS1_44180 [Paenibacillus montaniterrae]|uniref:alpha-L-rhamnosidase n=1 Tax=Paenibacillus montaniterrae TaxID=429341 RepID=A0A919YWZ0_9BACL|nr:family 78 glycoside hydrolase catalytic domain [Paenibacillus montaniterrae]GIP18776.1 hypothetical protein J40TS1_44180 [Paenibacillus montaniterrae]